MRTAHRRRVHAIVLALAAAVLALVASTAQASTPATPIPQDPVAGSVQPFLGSPRPAAPVRFGPQAPRHPFMAPNSRSNIHDDAYQSDAYPGRGPLGSAPAVASALFASECASVTFDARGRIVTVCVGAVRPTLRLLDPHTLATLASFDLPPRPPQSLPGLFTSFGGGGYFYLDNHDRAVVPTNDGHLYVIREAGTPTSPSLALARNYDVSSVAAGSSIESALPDWSGRLWFLTDSGAIGVVDPSTGRVTSTHLPAGETIANSLAVDETGGVFIVSSQALYRFDAGSGGQPHQTWRQAYDRGVRQKPGQTQWGSGTTPTIIRRGNAHYVAITDNADPRMHVLVFRADRTGTGGKPLCSVPVFAAGKGSTDNSLIAIGNSLIVENNYGYTGPVAAPSANPPPSPSRATPTTEPGVTRIDVDYGSGGCHAAWTNSTVRVPTSVSKASAAAGLVYVYSHPAADEVRYRSSHPGDEDPWYLTALDLRTGHMVWSRFTGVGVGYNNNYAPISLGPDGTAYIGTLGGLVSVRDTGGAAG
jgi:hypothetical protein